MIFTERLEVRPICEDDYRSIWKLYENKQVRKYLGGTIDEETFKPRFYEMLGSKNSEYYWAVLLKEQKEFIGVVSLDSYHDQVNTEIGYQFLPDYWGKGYAKEVVKEVVHYGFNHLHLARIIAETQAANERSCRLLESVGMKFVEHLERFGNQQSKYLISSIDYNNCQKTNSTSC